MEQSLWHLSFKIKGGVEITPSEPQALITCVGNPSFPTKVIWVHIWLLKLSLKFAQVLYVSLTSQSRPSVHEGRKGLPASLFPSPHQPSKAIQVGLIHLAPHCTLPQSPRSTPRLLCLGLGVCFWWYRESVCRYCENCNILHRRLQCTSFIFKSKI